MNMPPHRKSRRTAGLADDTVEVQFVLDPVKISPQAAVEASTSGVGSEGLVMYASEFITRHDG